MNLQFPVSATVSAPRRLVDAHAGWAPVAFPVRYGLFPRRDGIVLIDTGYGPELFAAGGWALHPYRWMLRPKLEPAGLVSAALAALGAEPADVRHIVVTHLHADHVCGIGRFAQARLHMSRETAALWAARPRLRDIHAGFFRALVPPFPASRVSVVEDQAPVALPWGGQGFDMLGDGSAIAVDLPGHMAGHLGVFFPHRDVPLLYAVDADWTLAPILSGRPPNWPAGTIVHDPRLATRSGATVRAAAAGGVDILLCHEPAPWP